MRFFRRSATETLRRFLDIRDQLPTDAELIVRPSFELRALRPWEEFDEGVIRWWGFYQAVAIVGQLSSVLINPRRNTVGLGALPPAGTLITLDFAENHSAAPNVVQLIAGPNNQVGPGFSAIVYQDTRHGPVASVGPVSVVVGQANAGGGIVGRLNSVDTVTSRLENIGWVSLVGDGDPLELRGTTLNTTVACSLRGRIIPPR